MTIETYINEHFSRLKETFLNRKFSYCVWYYNRQTKEEKDHFS